MEHDVHKELHALLDKKIRGLPIIVNPGKGYKSPNKAGKPPKVINPDFVREIRAIGNAFHGWPMPNW